MTIDERIGAELRRLAPEVDEQAAWRGIESKARDQRSGRTIRLLAVSTAAIGCLVLGVVLLRTPRSDLGPTSQVQNPILGTWVATDLDGSSPTMVLEASGATSVEMIAHDDLASVCSGAPSTMTGTGRFQGDSVLVFPAPVFTCDDGSQPMELSGPPLEEQLQNLAFTHDPVTDSLTDNFGSVWTREGVEAMATGWWPQSNLEEVRGAQQLADAGDPDYTWQVDATLAAYEDPPYEAEIFARFVEEKLGWEEFIGGWDGSSYGYVEGGHYEGVTFIRCAPGETNSLSHLYANAPPAIRGCAPTIDELSYETVSVTVAQPGRRGSDGIWVVDRWEMLEPVAVDGQASLFDLIYPELEFGGRVEQVVPPSDAEVTALLEAFLGARVDGEGAEQYLVREPEESQLGDHEVPILYATTSGALYERFEIQRLLGPVWPSGWTEYKVRLFAEEGRTVVEQLFHVVRQVNGRLGLIYGHSHFDLPTTENGQSVPVPFSLLDGEVTFTAAPPWRADEPSDTHVRFNGSRDDHVVIATDLLGPLNCDVPADAEELANRIMVDPDVETTGMVPVRIAGLDGLQIDVDVDLSPEAVTASNCGWLFGPDQSHRWRMRLYLIDILDGSAPVLAIAVIAAPETDFERVLEEAMPIVRSIEIHGR